MKNLRYVNKYFWKYRGRLLFGFLLIAAGNVFSVYAPVVVRDGIDFLADALSAKEMVESGKNTTIAQPQSFQNIASWLHLKGTELELSKSTYVSTLFRTGLLLAGLYLLMFLIKGIFLFYQRQAIIVMSRHIEYDLKNEIYNKYQELDWKFYKMNRTGDLMNRISEDVNRVRMYLGPAVMYTLNLIVLLVMCVIVMLQIDVELTMYTLAPLPFMMLAIFYVSSAINRRTDKVQTQQSKLSSIVQETISGIRVLKAFHREEFYSKSFSQESEKYKEKQLLLVKTDALFMPVIVLLVGLSTILTIYVGAHKVMRGEISPGVIVQFVFYVNILTWPFAIVGWVTSLVQKAEASQTRINAFLQTQPDIYNSSKSETDLKGGIEFNNVTYTYADSGIKALDAISFQVPRGKTVGIIGRTGSGKSTIAQLILRLMDPTLGEIRIKNVRLPDHDLHSVRQNIGYVPQEVFLFSDTIKNNIAFGVDETTDDQIIQSAKDADIHDNIVLFPEKYETMLGERGINLSGGQKQRISIARAIIKNPEILVFDDCLSAVDTETEDHILQSLKKVMQGKTSVFIAHRISSIKNCDNIIVLDQGKIVEEGNHTNLISKNGFYAQLFRQQLMEGSEKPNS
jgi:ATP-binding cassette subfamily B multidrug efflux pump